MTKKKIKAVQQMVMNNLMTKDVCATDEQTIDITYWRQVIKEICIGLSDEQTEIVAKTFVEDFEDILDPDAVWVGKE